MLKLKAKIKKSEQTEFFDTDFMIKLMFIMFTWLLVFIGFRLDKIILILEALAN